MIVSEEEHLAHYGILRRSGRYPWGSGGSQSARNKSYLDTIENLRAKGMSETDIARGFGMTTTQLRAAKTIARNQQTQEKIAQAQALADKGYSNSAIAKRMSLAGESSVRALLAPAAKDRADILQATAKMLKEEVDKHDLIDVGLGVENLIGVPKNKLQTAVAMLQEEGYKVHYVKVPQVTTGNVTTQKVLSKPGVPYSEVYARRGEIKQIGNHSDDMGRTYENPLVPPKSISSRRIDVRYAEDGGDQADGVIYIRPGVKDLSLGKSAYAQVRIAVDGTHYLKGMAVYHDDLPEGKDIVFNTNKSNTGRKKDALKPMEADKAGNIDPMNPFGASIRRQNESKVMNIVNEEGDWDTWSKNLPSQFLSKQDPKLAVTQLNAAYDRRKQGLDDITRLTNPVVRRRLLESFADETDSSAVDLKAAAFHGQSTKVILPVSSMKPGEVYAPSVPNGTRVALVRFPHGGTFEIPQLIVNNRNPEAKKMLGTSAKDAIAIHHTVAKRLSGADFDGDHVLVIPNNSGQVKSTPALKGLEDFDPRHSFPAYPGMPKITSSRKGYEMGNVSNLITDMTIKGAKPDEIVRAVRHSMVVIDSEKHNLDYKASARANGIPQLKARYQGSAKSGAKTLISRAGARADIPKRKPRPAMEGGPIDRATGRKMYVPTGETYVDKKTGKTVVRTERHKRLAVTDDAHELVSPHGGTIVERVYADHSNRLKALANEARKELVNTANIPYSESAAKTYAPQVASLNHKLNVALKNAPIERQAQVLANVIVNQKKQANPDMDADDEKKIRNQAIAEARLRMGAKKHQIQPTQEEWNAIQAGALSNHKLTQVIRNSDLDVVKKLATPKMQRSMTANNTARAKQMLDSGYTQAEVARALGVSLSTLKVAIEEM